MNVFEDAGYFVRRQPARGDAARARRAVHPRRLEGRARVRRLRPARGGGVLRARSPRCSTSSTADGVVNRVLFLAGRRADAAHPLQGDPPAPSAGAARQRGRRHPARGGAARADPRARRLHHRHDGAERRPMLRRKVASEMLAPGEPGKLAVSFVSFGHKHGPPRDADLAFDVRFLPNPHYEADLRPLTGFDQPDRRVRRPRRAPRGVLRARAAPARVPAAPVRGRGQVAPRRRRRLHGRPAPLRGHRRAPGARTSARTGATSSRCSTATSTGPRAAPDPRRGAR